MNPRLRFALIVGVGAAIIGAVVLTPILTVPVLSTIGFGAAGPVAGTFAAAAQAGIGNVVAGSLFATVQSAAMGGAIPALAYVVGGAVTGLLGMAISTFAGARTRSRISNFFGGLSRSFRSFFRF